MRSLMELNSLALKTRRMLGEDNYSPIDLFALINGWTEKKITLIRQPMSERISGMSSKIDDCIVIVINSNQSYGRQKFTLAHELYHVLFENGFKTIVCDMNMGSDKSVSEKEADWFASYLLIPQDALFNFSEDIDKWTIENLVEAEQFFQVSHQCLLHRLYMDKQITLREMENFRKIPVIRKAASLGYNVRLYTVISKDMYCTTGDHIRNIEKCLERDLISDGKREEMLMNAYRADMVYGFGEDSILND